MEEPVVPRRRWRRWLRSMHLYGGLICSGYLVVYGVSSLLFSHHIGESSGTGDVIERTATVSAPIPRDDANETAQRLARELGLMGRVPPSAKWNDSSGLTFEVVRPGHRMDVRAADNGQVTIEEQSLGLSAVLKGLHDARRYPDSLVLSMWWNYTHLTVIVLLFSTISGIVLWLGTRRFTALGWSGVVGGSIAMLLLTGWLVA